MEHKLKQIAKPIGVMKQEDGTIDLKVRSTIFDENDPITKRYPPEWCLSKEMLDITDKEHVKARLGLTDETYSYWMGQLK